MDLEIVTTGESLGTAVFCADEAMVGCGATVVTDGGEVGGAAGGTLVGGELWRWGW